MKVEKVEARPETGSGNTEENKTYKLYKCPECRLEFTKVDRLADHYEFEHSSSLVLEEKTIKPRLATSTEYFYVLAREDHAETAGRAAENRAMARVDERLGRALEADKLIVVDQNATPALICSQILEELTKIDQKRIVSGSIQSDIRGDNIFFTASLVLPFSEKNMNAITAFANNIQQPKP